ncbi:heavy-metal-associated domain-containing protein [Candidatus Uhrbacteria bacterium]|nr:heavy-metal-associated domain-containing protein [Candidatus Uhrbacteria bacterium]MBI4256838.1 heavy-metal-associated domain-containing protein [Candidatus Uhrbacteria bacterium]
MNELTFTITNLTCDACIKLSTMALRKLPGVMDVSVELSTGAARVASTEPISPSVITEVLKAKGYEATF